ncbi:MAG: CPBP family intramembrane glutamic endopeptidase [Bacteroidota bacterium]
MKQLITYFLLSYLISWSIWFPLYAHIFGVNNLPALTFQHALGALGPLLASFITTFIFLKKEGINILLKKCFQIKPIIYLIIALFSPFLLAILASVINYFISNEPIQLVGLLTTKEFPQLSFISFLFYTLIFFGFGEEVGWRGFALPRLQNKMNALTASFLLALLWALWHLPLFFYRPGYTSMELPGIIGWIFSLLTGSVLLTWLFNSSRGSILICAVFHSTIDIAFTADVTNKNIVNYMGFLITVLGILIIILFKPKNLALVNKIQKT